MMNFTQGAGSVKTVTFQFLENPQNVTMLRMLMTSEVKTVSWSGQGEDDSLPTHTVSLSLSLSLSLSPPLFSVHIVCHSSVSWCSTAVPVSNQSAHSGVE